MNKSLAVKIYKHKYYFALLLPAIIWYIIFCYVPMAGILLSFKDYSFYKGFNGSPWVGLKWFDLLISSPDFFSVLKNTLLISVYMLIFAFPAPIILAVMLNECRQIRFKKIIQTVSYLPRFISWPIIAGLIVVLLSPSVGIVNQIIKMLGGEPIYFMALSKYTRSIFVFSTIWKDVGWGSIIYLAAITTIDIQLYESATIDGASKWRQIWHITLPGMSSLITMMLILRIAGLFNVGFEQAYNLVIPPTYETGRVISMYIYQKGVQETKYSFGTAVGLAQSLVSILLLTGANKFAKYFNEDGKIW